MRLVLVALVSLIVAACGPTVSDGYLTEKRDVPAHDEEYLQTIYIGQSCTTYGKTEYCTPRYIYLPATRRVERACYVTLQGQDAKQERYVGCDGWDALAVGQRVTLK